MHAAYYEEVALIGEIFPASQTTQQATAWVDAGQYHEIVAEFQIGLIAAGGTVDASIQQATSAAGAGAKEITGKAITQLADTADNQNLLIRLRPEELDLNNGFRYVRLQITPAVAAALMSGQLKGVHPRFHAVATTLYDQVVD